MIRVRDNKGRIVKNNDIYNYTKEKEVGVDVWVLRYRLREAGFPSRDSLIKEYFKRFLKVKENIKKWCNKIPFDYCTFNTMKKAYEKK